MLARPPSGGGLGSRLRAALGLAPTMDAAAWEAAEEALIAADLGPVLAAEVVEAARSRPEAVTSGPRCRPGCRCGNAWRGAHGRSVRPRMTRPP